MNCWKSINLTKEFGLNRLYLISLLTGLLAFVIFYVPSSIIHGAVHVNESGTIPFLISLCLLPTIHSFMHILPLIMMNKRVKLIYKRKYKILPLFTYYTKTHVPKNVSLLVAIAPTMLITLPGIAACYLFTDYYVYILLFTSVHIGITFLDFLYIIYIIKAPSHSFIENGNHGFDILIKSPK